MDLRVRKGYVVFYGGLRYEAGCLLPASSLKEVLINQSWKVEGVINVKQEKEERQEREEIPTASNSDGEEKEEMKDIASNRMMKSSAVKKKNSNSKKPKGKK